MLPYWFAKGAFGGTVELLLMIDYYTDEGFGLNHLCRVFLSILWISFVSSHALDVDQSSPLKATEAVRSTSFVRARKLKLMEEARVNDKVGVQGFQDPKQKNEHKENVSGQLYKREQSGMNAADMSSRFFTMDYAHVKRRRPVHNMSFQHP